MYASTVQILGAEKAVFRAPVGKDMNTSSDDKITFGKGRIYRVLQLPPVVKPMNISSYDVGPFGEGRIYQVAGHCGVVMCLELDMVEVVMLSGASHGVVVLGGCGVYGADGVHVYWFGYGGAEIVGYGGAEIVVADGCLLSGAELGGTVMWEMSCWWGGIGYGGGMSGCWGLGFWSCDVWSIGIGGD